MSKWKREGRRTYIYRTRGKSCVSKLNVLLGLFNCIRIERKEKRLNNKINILNSTNEEREQIAHAAFYDSALGTHFAFESIVRKCPESTFNVNVQCTKCNA